ncbi:MAG: trimethylamine methyltransferase family protein, partial [Candidatus Heimdallarchaeota archaeon]|nr:trimethylamine methyltransferase family protein [Candidatus Heimdallarchaeota archaeon]MCK4254912.1 trimethylamine methyltransferase family protein [Candidatus Heimdallarchaeota archaeon]
MRPVINVLEEEIKEKVIIEAMEILEEIGVFVENTEAAEILQRAGINVDSETQKAFIPADLVKKSLKTAPQSISLYNRDGDIVSELGGSNICFDPGSAALNVLDRDTNKN